MILHLCVALSLERLYHKLRYASSVPVSILFEFSYRVNYSFTVALVDKGGCNQ